MSEVFHVRRTVRFADCDAAGIMFFPRLMEMLNGVVEAWFEGPLGLSFRTLHLERGWSVPTARLEAEFHAPSRLEDVLDWRLGVTRLGHSSCALRHRVDCGGQARLSAGQTLVFVAGAMRAAPWPDELRGRLAAFVETGAEGA